MLLNALDRIEVNIRTKIIYNISLRYIDDPCWFVNRRYVTSKFINDFEEQVYAAMRKNPVIQHHHANHRGIYAPAWKTIEFMTIGNIITLYDSLKEPEAKDLVANAYGCSRGVFYNYMETIRVLRNKCAHGSCIYRMDFPKGIKRLPAGVSEDCLFLLCVYVPSTPDILMNRSRGHGRARRQNRICGRRPNCV